MRVIRDLLSNLNFRKILNILIIAAAIVVAAIIIFRDSGTIDWTLLRFRPLFIILGYLVATSGLLISIPVWRSMLKVFGLNAQLREDILFYNLGMLGYALPGGIWSIASRVSLYSAKSYNGSAVIIAGVLEALITGVAGLLLYAVTTLRGKSLNLFQSPFLAIGVAVLSLIIIHPKVFSKISSAILKKSNLTEILDLTPYKFKHLCFWIIGEAMIIILGSTGLFLLLESFTPVGLSAWAAVLSAWSAANAVSALLFWVPGTPILRDGAMALALSTSIPLASAIIFVVVQRIWSLVSLLLNAFIVWSIFGNPIKIHEKRDLIP